MLTAPLSSQPTHGIVVNALTGVNLASGEMVIVKPGLEGEPVIVGRLKVD